MILGVTVVEDIFIAIYLAIVSVVLSGETEIWPVVGKLAIAFLFLIVMFTVARWGGRFVSRLFRTKDDELFTILFFGLAIMFGGIGEILGRDGCDRRVPDRPRAGRHPVPQPHRADRHPAARRVRRLLLPQLRPGARPHEVRPVLVPVLGAVLMTVVLNAGAGSSSPGSTGSGPEPGSTPA